MHFTNVCNAMWVILTVANFYCAPYLNSFPLFMRGGRTLKKTFVTSSNFKFHLERKACTVKVEVTENMSTPNASCFKIVTNEVNTFAYFLLP